MLRSLARAAAAAPSAARSLSTEAPAAASRGSSGTVVLFGSLTALTAGLCAWQLYRYQWKVSVLQERDALLNSPPLDISAGLLPSDLAAMRPVHVQGARLEAGARVLQLSPRTAPEGLPASLARQTITHSGRQLVAPLRRKDGSRILAILGWVPSDVDLPSPACLPPGTSEADIAGVLRRTVEPGVWGVPSTSSASSSASSASPPSSSEQGVYPFLNTAVLAEAYGMSASRGDVVDAALEVLAPFPEPSAAAPPAAGASSSSSSSWPVTRQREQLLSASLAPPYTHLIYAATWAALALYGGAATLRRMQARGGRGVRRLAL